jgi:peptidyl-prolyl cis-trans isomerase C
MTRIPEDKRAEFRTSYDRVAGIVDNLFLARTLAARARADGLDKDPLVQRRLVQLQESFLADLYLQQFDKQVENVNLEARAKELYQADPSKYLKPEAVHVAHILVDLEGRTPEMAETRAKQAYDEAKSGKASFEDLAVRFSDDRASAERGGDVGWAPVKSVPPEVASEVAKLQKPGDLTPPIRTHRGYEIVRLIERRKAEPMKFDEAKKTIIAEEQARLRQERREELVRQIRSSPSAVVNTRNVEALVVPVEKLLSSASSAPKDAKPAK